MRVYIIGGRAFAEISPNYLLLIGSEEDMKDASAEDIQEMVENAILVKGLGHC